MLATQVDFLFFKYMQKTNTLHLVFTYDEKKSSLINISSSIQEINTVGFSVYDIITKSNSHYLVHIEQEILNKYYNQLEILQELLKN